MFDDEMGSGGAATTAEGERDAEGRHLGTTGGEGFNAYFEGRSSWGLVARGVESEDVAAPIVELMCGAYEGFGRGSVKACIDDGPDAAPWVGALYRTPTLREGKP